MLCQKEAVEREPLAAMVNRMDEDESSRITFKELVISMSNALYPETKEKEKHEESEEVPFEELSPEEKWEKVKESKSTNEHFKKQLKECDDQ